MKDKQSHKAQIIFSLIAESQEGFSAKEKKTPHLEVSLSGAVNKVSVAILFKTFSPLCSASVHYGPLCGFCFERINCSSCQHIAFQQQLTPLCYKDKNLP